MKYEVYEANLPQLIKRITRLSARTVKIGNPPITCQPTGVTREVENPDRAGTTLRVMEVEVTGDAPVYNGWHFMATICATEEGNVIRAVPGYEVPVEYREGSHFCDHCKTNRLRRDTYVVRHDDGRTQRVGSTCIQDFLHHNNPNSLTMAARLCWEAHGMAEAATQRGWLGGSGMNDVYRVDLEEFLGHVAQVVLDNGRFVTRKVAMESGKASTRDLAEHRMRDVGWRDNPQISAAARALATEAWEWVLRTYSPTIADVEDGTDALKASILGHFKAVRKELTDFEHNLLTVARSEAIEPRLMGIAAYIVEAYRKDQAREAAANRSNTTLNGAGLMRIFSMFDAAKKNELKRPAIRLTNEANHYMVLTLAGAVSKNAGCIYVKGERPPSDGGDWQERPEAPYFGKITPDGRFFPARECPSTVGDQLKAFAEDPEAIATKYGKLTGCCCFCGRRLTDERSTVAGYGPICAGKFGLNWGQPASAEAPKTEVPAEAQCVISA